MSDKYIVFSQKRVFGAPKSYFQGCFWGNGIVFGNFKPFLGKIVLFLGEQRKEFRVRKKDYKGRCTKVASSKSETACRLYDDLMIAYLRNLERILSNLQPIPLLFLCEVSEPSEAEHFKGRAEGISEER